MSSSEVDYSGYRITQSTVLRDSLDRADLSVNVLANGCIRYVFVLPHKDGIATHYVFEQEAMQKPA